MPALNFKERFVYPIQQRRKKHTIRAERKIPIKVGDSLYLFCGMRQKGAFRILPDAVPCTQVQKIEIKDIGSRKFVFVDNDTLMPDECERLAEADGFDNFSEMMQFWEGRLPFKGSIIHWNPDPHEVQSPRLAKVKPCPKCGYKFDHHLLGKYGCPNCNGEGLK